ncbi:DUF5994 family protein [Plantactinospora solaniradicis]|uniref:DUF5994 family protein n=1 Tax=Plantactinospora solaniradicis TaxID=1723736 RepID=A0ABW1KMM3_9ACTN
MQHRLVFAPVRASRAGLDGGWWPRSWEPAELPGLVLTRSSRYGRMRNVILNDGVPEHVFGRCARAERYCPDHRRAHRGGSERRPSRCIRHVRTLSPVVPHLCRAHPVHHLGPRCTGEESTFRQRG